MFKTIIKLFAIYVVNRRIAITKDNFGEVKSSLANYAESRALLAKRDFSKDLQRLLMSVTACLLAFVGISLAIVTALAWGIAASWDSPYRAYILSAIIITLVLSSTFIIARVRHEWRRHGFMQHTSFNLSRDWHLFRSNIERNHDV